MIIYSVRKVTSECYEPLIREICYINTHLRPFLFWNINGMVIMNPHLQLYALTVTFKWLSWSKCTHLLKALWIGARLFAWVEESIGVDCFWNSRRFRVESCSLQILSANWNSDNAQSAVESYTNPQIYCFSKSVLYTSFNYNFSAQSFTRELRQLLIEF